ncbi:unnamed protein product, partial [marine sediment metagenome]
IDRKLSYEDENIGLCVFGDELSSEFSIDNTAYGKYIVFSMRMDSISIGKEARLHIKKRVAEYKRSFEVEDLSSKQLAEIREEVYSELAENAKPNINTLQVLIDTTNQSVLISSAGTAMCDKFNLIFTKAFEIKLTEMNFVSVANGILDSDVFEQMLDHPGIAIVKDLEVSPEFEDTPEGHLGSGFLTWLLFSLSTGDGIFKCSDKEEYSLVVMDQLTMQGEAVGVRTVDLKKGVLGRCAELKSSLHQGKQVSKMLIHMAVGRMMEGTEGDNEEDFKADEWDFSIDKRNFDFGNLKVPKSDSSGDVGKLLQRFGYITDAVRVMDDIFEHYLTIRYHKNWIKTIIKIQEWIKGM